MNNAGSDVALINRWHLMRPVARFGSMTFIQELLKLSFAGFIQPPQILVARPTNDEFTAPALSNGPHSTTVAQISGGDILLWISCPKGIVAHGAPIVEAALLRN